MKKTITICASVSFYKQILEIEKELKNLGFKTIVPSTAKKMKKSGNFDALEHKNTYLLGKFHIKKRFMMEHFEAIEKGDAILVVNLEKNGKKGYIGGNVLIEMALALYLKKPIFIYKDIEKGSSIEEEILGMLPKFINGDLSRIKLARSRNPNYTSY